MKTITQPMFDKYLSINFQVNYAAAFILDNKIYLCPTFGTLLGAKKVDMVKFKKFFVLGGTQYGKDYVFDIKTNEIAGIVMYEINQRHLIVTRLHDEIREYRRKQSELEETAFSLKSSIEFFNSEYGGNIVVKGLTDAG